MSDGKSARIFGDIFRLLANGDLNIKILWEMRQKYDFSPDQMNCDKALEKLGLSWICSGEGCLKSNDGSPVRQYGPDNICPDCGTEKGN